MKEFKKEQHPSYGMLSLHRVSGSHSSALFGSSIKHRNTIRLEISHGELQRGLNNDWYHAKGCVVECEMSQSQFAEAITSMNMGDGVPVTLLFTEKDGRIPEGNYTNKIEQFTTEFSDSLNNVKSNLDDSIKNMEEIIDSKKTLNKSDKEKMLSILKFVKSSILDNESFIFNCFTEQMDNTVKEAKGEIEAFMQNKINSIAHAALMEQKDNKQNLLDGIENPIEV